jgi:hypothetical protein
MPRRRPSIVAVISAAAAGRGVAVAGHQLRRPGQELDDLSLISRLGGLSQPRIALGLCPQYLVSGLPVRGEVVFATKPVVV